MYLNNAYNCSFNEHSKVTAHNQTDQLHEGDHDGLQEGPTRIRTGRQMSVTTQAESEGLSSPKNKKILVHVLYIHTHCSVQSGPHPESMTRSPLIGLKKVSTGLSSMGVRRQLSSVGSVSANCDTWRVKVRFYIRWNVNNKCKYKYCTCSHLWRIKCFSKTSVSFHKCSRVKGAVCHLGKYAYSLSGNEWHEMIETNYS